MTPKQHPRVSMTLEQIGKRFGISKERVRQIEKKALHKMRVGLELEGINSIESVREWMGIEDVPSDARVAMREFDRAMEHEAAA